VNSTELDIEIRKTLGDVFRYLGIDESNKDNATKG